MKTTIRIITLLSLLLGGCTSLDEGFTSNEFFSINTENTYNSTELEFQLENFQRITGIKRSVTIRYNTEDEYIKEGILGICLHTNDGLVIINRQLIDRPIIELDWTVYHELLHCLSGLRHSEDPMDIMFPYLTDQALQFLREQGAEAVINYSLQKGNK